MFEIALLVVYLFLYGSLQNDVEIMFSISVSTPVSGRYTKTIRSFFLLVLILDRYQTLYQPRSDISSGKRDKISATITHYLFFLLFPCEFRPIKLNLLIREAIIIASQILHSKLDLIY